MRSTPKACCSKRETGCDGADAQKEEEMRIGVFTVLFKDLPFEKALDKATAAGISAVEIGTGGYPGSHHCPVDELLASQGKRDA